MINICFRDLYLIFLTIVIFYLLYKNNEPFQGTTTSGYQADVEAIRNLSSIATQLTKDNTLTNPGNLKIANKLSTNNLNPNDIPDGWTGGIRTSDVYSSGTIACGRNGKDIKASINRDGNANFTGNITVGGNTSISGKLSTNGLDPNNMPDGWGGGIRTFDVYSSGTVACGKNGKDIKASINSDGNANFTSNLTVGGKTIINNDLEVSKNTNEGGSLTLVNPKKTGSARKWVIFNMTGEYKNRLSFLAYDENNKGIPGIGFDLYDNGDIHLIGNVNIIGSLSVNGIKRF